MIRRIVTLCLLLALVLLAAFFFMPRSYQVPVPTSKDQDRFWQLSTGSRIRYVRIPSAPGTMATRVIYLHGGPGGFIRASVVSAFAPLAGKDIDLYLYDQFGGGNSNRAEDITEYTVDRHVRDLAEIVDSVGGGKVVLVGQSWGAIFATVFASRYPDKIEGLILTCPGPVFPVKQERASLPVPDSIHLTRPLFTNAMGNKMTGNLRMKAVDLFATRFGWKIASDKEADAFAAFSGYYIDRSTVCDTSMIPPMERVHGYYAGLRTFRSLTEVRDYRALLSRASYPVLVLKGQCDNQPWGYTKEYLELFRNSKLKVIPGAGHFLWVEKPAELRQAITGFAGGSERSP